MRHRLVGLFARPVKAKRMIGIIRSSQRHAFVGTVNGRRGCINEMLAAPLTTAFQHIQEANEIGIRISMRMLQGVTNSGLCRQMHDEIEPVRSE